jgi:hypothetical protein
MTMLTSVLVILSGLLVVITVALPGYASALLGSVSNNNSYTTLVPTPNMIAAGGPIPTNYTMAQQEAECAAALENPPWD